MIRRTLVAIALAATTLAAAASAQPSHPSVDPTGSYWIAITMPDRDATAAVLVLDESAGALRGMLVVEGSPAAALDKISVDGNEVRAEVGTSAGLARLTVRLKDRTGEGSLELLAKRARR